jgi:hypothetical protein
MNNRDDFLPETRNQSWWATDSRRAVDGKAIEVILEKQGKKDLDDLSHIEAVRMGHIMQPTILNLAQDALKIGIKDADYMLTHPKEQWLRSHFDGITEDGKMLIEAKNYNASVRNKYDFETGRLPKTDWVQLVHECVVHQVDKICLAVLFGGNEFKHYVYDVTKQDKEDLIKEMAVYWAHVQTLTLPEPQTVESTKLAYPASNDAVLTATSQLEFYISKIKNVNDEIKRLEEHKEAFEVEIRNFMGAASEIVSIDGRSLVTWKSSKGSKRFSADLFKSSMPDVYDQFIVDMPGARRFLIK